MTVKSTAIAETFRVTMHLFLVDGEQVDVVDDVRLWYPQNSQTPGEAIRILIGDRSTGQLIRVSGGLNHHLNFEIKTTKFIPFSQITSIEFDVEHVSNEKGSWLDDDN